MQYRPQNFSLADACEELKGQDHVIGELEKQIARGETECSPTKAEAVLASLVRLLADEPDQTAWVFQARVSVQGAMGPEQPPTDSDVDEGMTKAVVDDSLDSGGGGEGKEAREAGER